MKTLLTFKKEINNEVVFEKVVKNIDKVTLKDLEKAESPYIDWQTKQKAIDSAYAFRMLKDDGIKIAFNGDKFPCFLERAVDSFNEFDVMEIADKIRLLNKMRTYLNENNPNNGKSILKIWLTGDAEIIFEFYGDKEELEKVIKNIELFRLPKADEFDFELKECGYKYKLFIRNWWD